MKSRKTSATAEAVGETNVANVAIVFESVRAMGENQGSARQLVYEQIRRKILDAELVPGSVLPENTLAAVLEISRTPLREALQRLQSEGLVQVIPQVGTFVAKLELTRIREALFMREAVECAALMNVAMPIASGMVEDMRSCVTKHLEAVERADLNATMQYDAMFHRLLLEASGLVGVWRYVHEARELHRRVRVLSRSQTNLESVRRSVDQHREIVLALEEQRLDDAQSILRAHIRMNVQLAEDIARAFPEYFVE
ncbi:GntR family transcriptional regulator [Burkholderia anthina]|uniref:GntR family transcriptional regulator n=1 Tax=Burkholderia anthina TaxID=179879 RepID=UPI00158A25F8|nr:GntR family transcriptional regulator [Burkholderia anthina]